MVGIFRSLTPYPLPPEQGTICYDLNSDKSRLVHITPQDVSRNSDDNRHLRLVSSRQAVNASGLTDHVIKSLGLHQLPILMDSMGKYAVVARNDVAVYTRHCLDPDYRENVWDHAAGVVVLQEAGGKVSDLFGRPLDFSRGAKLSNNVGIVAAHPSVHEAVVASVREYMIALEKARAEARTKTRAEAEAT